MEGEVAWEDLCLSHRNKRSSFIGRVQGGVPMRSALSRVQKCARCAFFGGFLPSLLILFGAAERGRPAKIDLLRIGTTGTMSPEGDGRRDKGAMKSLR